MTTILPGQTGINPFGDITARDWLASCLWAKQTPQFSGRCMLFGNGPFECNELAQFLLRYNIPSCVKGVTYEDADEIPNPNVPWEFLAFQNSPPLFVLGEADAITPESRSLLSDLTCRDKPTVNAAFSMLGKYWLERFEIGDGTAILIRSQSLKNARFMSQQMLLATLFAGTASIEQSPWTAHAALHPALRQLPSIAAKLKQEENFEWPSVEVPSATVSGHLSKDEWPQIGLLKYLGYSVGVNGVVPDTRQHILTKAFELESLPQVESEQYVISWGKARSAARLRKTAESIAAFCRNAKLRDEVANRTAIADWEADLMWLKRSFYDGRFDGSFTWPKPD